MKVSTHWLKDFVAVVPPLERLADRLTMAGLEVKRIEPRPDLKDTVFEVEITTNRPDWLSHLGVAREIHVIENTGLKIPSLPNPGPRPMPSGWRLDLKAAEGCPYYTACLLEGVELVPTPDWMRNRLLACGLRSVNLFVDITNYVLLEMGQPLHAFDADWIRGKEVLIRRAKTGEALTAINGTKYSLNADDLVITDSERPLALAGVMGGRESEVSERTRNILLESAFFHPRWIRKTSLRLGLTSESSYRFERRVDPEGVDQGRERAVALLREWAHARSVSAVLKAGRKPTLEKTRLHLSLDQVEKLLGMEVKPHQIHSVLTRLGLEPKNENPQTWTVEIPTYRADLERPVDLIEEVVRIHGYEKVPETLPVRAPIEIPANPLRSLEEKTRDFMAGSGLFETVTFSLVNPSHFRRVGIDLQETAEIHNPIHQDLTLLRPSFLVSLLEVEARNERMGARSFPFFELGPLYSRRGKGALVTEVKSLGILLGGEREAGWEDPKRPFNFFDLKGILENYFDTLKISNFSFSSQDFPFFEQGAKVQIGKETLGFGGEISPALGAEWGLHSRAFYAEFSLEALLKIIPENRKFKEFPRFPAVERDLSVVVKEAVTSGEVVEFIRQKGEGLIRRVELFDLFRGGPIHNISFQGTPAPAWPAGRRPGRGQPPKRGGRIPQGHKNLAFRLTYQSLERTLRSEEIQPLHSQIAEEVMKKFQAAFQEK